MKDADGPHIAKAVYSVLFKDGKFNPDPDDIAYALDEAVRELRDRGSPAAHWATYIHIGI